MREIKFRAWDKKANIWVEGVTYTLHTSGRLLTTPPHVELMQYTGLKDRSGKDVYEGDILIDHNYPRDKPFVVAFGTQEFADSNYLAFCLGYNLDPGVTAHYEVIGNIYEHPALIDITDTIQR